MPWKVSSVMDVRVEFVEKWMKDEVSFGELCRRFGVSRKTGYKILKRFREGGTAALENWSCRPHRSPNRTPAAVESKIVEIRARHNSWGPKKIRYVFESEGLEGPAPSTIAAVLKRRGLVRPTARRRAKGVPSESLIEPRRPNDVWCIDFKGWFRTGNGLRCDPLTVLDSWSRFLVCCHGLFDGTKTEQVREVFERLFDEYGLPGAILSDNGSPWASTSAGGLTKLSVWWIKLGIMPYRIFPGRPQENGRLERFHRTLKAETARPAAMTAALQQTRFDEFRCEYNELRPHETLGQVPPGRLYEKSVREYRREAWGFDYPSHMVERRVYSTGQINWGDRLYHISGALSGETIGLEEDEFSPRARIYLGDYVVGVLDFVTGRVNPAARSVGLMRVGKSCCEEVGSGGKDGLIERVSVLPMSLE
ncbi:MAG: IS481 family transposase [Candidatus Sumerlaeaceae bacterium]|nr:IS481 family transposase [Candidatus Sumerlaeaceae bacterium]